MSNVIVLDGENLTCDSLHAIGFSQQLPKCVLCADAEERVQQGRQVVEQIIKEGKTKYGINTGFGNFATVKISDSNLSDLQQNLIRSHAAGVGDPIRVEQARMLLAIRINVLAKGNSGVRPETLNQLLQALNMNCISWVPAKGTVGASGDLAPLAHSIVNIIGNMYY